MRKGINSEWQWPRFEQEFCANMPERDKFGLPDYYFRDQKTPHLSEELEKIRTMSLSKLAERCEDSSKNISERIACGTMLAYLGDPRITPRAPHMIHIAPNDAFIGLPYEQIEDVIEQYKLTEIERHWILKECPRHQVTLGAYAIAKYPVTNYEYREFVLDTDYAEVPSSWSFRCYPSALANHPVYTVTPQAAEDYIHWLNQRTGRAFRLPTEAEWEYAAAGPEGLEFPWGNEFDAQRLNSLEGGLFQTTPIGVFPAGNSPFGLSDMAGNVEEYVTGNYQTYPNDTHTADNLPDLHSNYRIARGGSFARLRDLARTRCRHGFNPKSANYIMGFRLAEDV